MKLLKTFCNWSLWNLSIFWSQNQYNPKYII